MPARPRRWLHPYCNFGRHIPLLILLVKLPNHLYYQSLLSLKDEFLYSTVQLQSDAFEREPKSFIVYQMKFQFVSRAFFDVSGLTFASAEGTFLPPWAASLRIISPKRYPLSNPEATDGGRVTSPRSSCYPLWALLYLCWKWCRWTPTNRRSPEESASSDK